MLNTPNEMWVPTGDGHYIKQEYIAKLWELCIYDAYKVIKEKKSNEYNALKSEIYKDFVLSKHINNLVGDVGQSSLIELKYVMTWPILKALREGVDISRAVFIDEIESAYELLESFFYRKEFNRFSYTFIYGYDQEQQELVLSENLSIIRFGDKEMMGMLENGVVLFPPALDQKFVKPIRYALKQKSKLFKLIGEIEDNETETKEYLLKEYNRNKEKEAVLQALTVFKGGSIKAVCTVAINDNIFSGSVNESRESHIDAHTTKGMYLSSEEASNFKSFWLRHRKFFEDEVLGFLSFAIRRLYLSNQRKLIDDQIVDLVIACESIYHGSESGSGENDSIAFKVQTRSALYLSNNGTERKEIFDFMKLAYGCRSSIVHGRKLKTKGYTPEQIVGKLKSYIRLSITKIMTTHLESNIESWKEYWINLFFMDKDEANK
ncbi:hypothetical protein [Kangiella sp.]|uniref:hypothetical protein n=1 Tax=Kangiella sp. TaxID=1920245 RepID=UPI003A90749E